MTSAEQADGLSNMCTISPAGVYSVYIIAWGKREAMVHNGNLTEYFAKTTLTVR